MVLQMVKFETKLFLRTCLMLRKGGRRNSGKFSDSFRSTMFAQAVPTNTPVSISGTQPIR